MKGVPHYDRPTLWAPDRSGGSREGSRGIPHMGLDLEDPWCGGGGGNDTCRTIVPVTPA